MVSIYSCFIFLIILLYALALNLGQFQFFYREDFGPAFQNNWLKTPASVNRYEECSRMPTLIAYEQKKKKRKQEKKRARDFGVRSLKKNTKLCSGITQ